METYTSFRGFTLSNLVFTVGVDTKTATENINSFFASFNKAAQDTDRKLKESFEQPVKKEVELIFKNGEFVTREVQRAGTELDKVKLAAAALNKEWGKTPQELQVQIQALKLVQAETQKYRKDGITLTAQWRKITGAIDEAEKELKQLGDAAEGAGKEVEKIQQNSKKGDLTGQFLKANLAARALEETFKMVVGAIQNIVSTAFEMETLEIQLQAFTGGAEQAEQALREFSEIAAGTPFDLGQVANAGKIMMAFGVETDTATEATKNLAVVATATGGDLNNLARNLGQIAAQGQAYTRDLTQFAIQGIPIWSEMSAVTGKTVGELKKLATEGKISFEIVNTALKNLAAEGGKYAEIVKAYNNTMAGQLSRLRTNTQNFALGMINAAKDVAEAFGTDLYAPMKAINNELEYWGKELPNIVRQLPGAFAQFITDLEKIEGWLVLITGATTLAFGPQIVAAITAAAVAVGKYILQIKATIVALGAQIKAQVIALSTMGPKGWLLLAGAAGIATGAVIAAGKGMKGMRDAAMKAASALTKTNDSLTKTNDSLGGTSDEGKKTGVVLDDAFDDDKPNKYNSALKKVEKSLSGQKRSAEDQKKLVDKAIKAIKDRTKVAVEGLQDEKKAIKEALKEDLDRLEEVKKAIESKKEAALKAIEAERQAARNAHEQRISNLDTEAAAIKSQMSATDAYYDNVINRANAASDAEISRLNRRKSSISKNLQASLAGIEKLKTEEKNRYEAERQLLAQRKSDIEATYTAEANSLDALITKEQERQASLEANLEEQRALLEGRYEGAITKLERLKTEEEALYEAAKIALEEQSAAAEANAQERIAALDAEKTAQERFNEETLRAIEDRYEAENRLIENRKTILETQRDKELDSIQRVMDKIRFRYDEELAKLEKLKTEASTRYDAEIAALEALTPAEQRLEKIRRDRLVAQAGNAELSEEERLSAQAQLDDMERQKAIADIRIRQREEEAKFEKQKEELLRAQGEALSYQEGILEDRIRFYEDEIEAIEGLGESAIAVKEAQIEAENARYQNRIQAIENEQNAVEASLENELAAIEANAEATNLLYEQKLKNIEAEQEALAKTYQDNITAIEETRQAAKLKSDAVVLDLEREKEAAKQVYEGAKAEIELLEEAEKAKHDAIMANLDERAERVRRSAENSLRYIDNEIEKEREKADKKEQRLRILQVQERLASEAKLKAIEEEKEEEKKKFDAKEKQLDAEEQQIKDKYDAEADQIKIIEDYKKKAAEQRIKSIDKEIQEIKRRGEAEVENIKNLWTAYKDFYDNQKRALEDKKVLLKDVKKESEEGGDAIKNQSTQTQDLARAASQAAIGLQAQAQAQIALNNALAGATGGGGSNRASGGPVKGGTTYTVNEQGKEAFLSASGKLSMINAPSFGQWRAPSTGTVIPAHLTTQLDIPSGGINLKDINTAPSGMVSNAMSSVSRVVSGDNINNTVTIQTSKPRQMASDVMVQLAKLKRVRYS